ncbi:uncharacterized protein [Diadema antillarum]|uniref:uncharacterized protein n=1 Tax=Diadema antillarum TaxID=105358 RepID=UPI003A87C126
MASKSSITVKFRSIEDVYKCISEHEERYRVKFITVHKDKDFGKPTVSIPDPGKNFLRWRLDYGGQSPKIECDGTPFFYMHRHVYICHQGRDRNEKAKAKRKVSKDAEDASNDAVPKKRRKLVQDTKKMDCPASIYVVQILRFPTHRIEVSEPVPSGHSRVMAKKRLREEFELGADSIQTETLFYVSLPPLSSHVGHPVNNIAAGLREAVDPRILHKIVELTARGIVRVPEIRRHLEEYVQSELFHSSEQPHRTRRRYYPTDVDIRHAVQKAKKEIHTKVDQGNMSMLVKSWESAHGDFFEYRPLKAAPESGKFLFCSQTCWQQRLLNKYGTTVTVLDAVYRSAGYPLPLFLLSVRTNAGYVVVGFFVSHSDTAEDIAEALRIFMRWNPMWKPAAFLVDYFDPEIEAVKTALPDCTALFSVSRCEKMWTDWLATSSEVVNPVTRNRIIKTMHRVAMAPTHREHASALKVLRSMFTWKENELVANYFSSYWLSCSKRWAAAFQSESVRVSLYAAKGVRQQDEMFRCDYISQYKECSLSEVITVLYTKHFPAAYRRYVEFNARYSSSYLKYSEAVPAFLHSRPRLIVEHIEKNMASGIKAEGIQAEQNGQFLVRGDKSQAHRVSFGSEDKFPSCSCSYWSRCLLPCKHFCAIFRHVEGWSWDQLCESYRDNPLFCLDDDVLHDGDSHRHPPGGDDDDDLVKSLDSVKPESTKASSTPKRNATKCRQLINKNKDLLDKLHSQVSLVKDERFLCDMLHSLEKLSEGVTYRTKKRSQGSSRARRNNAETPKVKEVNGSSSVEGGVQIGPGSPTRTEDTQGSLYQTQVSNDVSSKGNNISGNRVLSVESNTAPNVEHHLTAMSQSSSQDKRSSRTQTSPQECGVSKARPTASSTNEPPPQGDVQGSSGDVAALHTQQTTGQQGKARLHSQAPTPSTQGGDMTVVNETVQTVVLKDAEGYLNIVAASTLGPGTEGSIIGHHDVMENITYVTLDPSLYNQEVLTSGNLINQAVDQANEDQGNFVIDAGHHEVTVTVANSELAMDLTADTTIKE